MDFFSSWHKLHISIRGFVIAIIGVSPFWYLLFYVLAGDRFTSHPYHVQIITVYCLTFVTYSISVIAIRIFENSTYNDETVYIIAFFCCCSILAFRIFGVMINAVKFTGVRNMIFETLLFHGKFLLGATLIIFLLDKLTRLLKSTFEKNRIRKKKSQEDN